MSNAVSALDGASYAGYASIEEQGLCGMITLRCDLGDAQLGKAIKAVAGVAVPQKASCNSSGQNTVAWMSPDELLILCPHAEAEKIVAALDEALKGTHHLAANVSDARAVFHITGKKCREVIAKLAPVDMDEDAFLAGAFRRTRVAQAPAAFWLKDSEIIELICFRSQAGYVFAALSRAASQGSEI